MFLINFAWKLRYRGRVARHRSAKPCTAVRIRSVPHPFKFFPLKFNDFISFVNLWHFFLLALKNNCHACHDKQCDYRKCTINIYFYPYYCLSIYQPPARKSNIFPRVLVSPLYNSEYLQREQVITVNFLFWISKSFASLPPVVRMTSVSNCLPLHFGQT